MKRNVFLILILLITLAACISVTKQTPLPETNTLIPPTATDVPPTNTPVPPIATLENEKNLDKHIYPQNGGLKDYLGFLWIGNDINDNYKFIDFSAEKFRSINIGDGCFDVLPNNIWVCKEGGNYYNSVEAIVYDFPELVLGKNFDVNLTPGYGYFFFSKSNENYYINIETEEISRIEVLNLSTFFPPMLSYDAKYVVNQYFISDVSDESKHFLAETNTWDYQEINSSPFPTFDFAWSPNTHQLVVGASDLTPEIGYLMNYLYLYDVENGDSKLIHSREDEGYVEIFSHSGDWEIWSPKGNYIVYNNKIKTLCFYSLILESKKCFELENPYTFVGSELSWSPDERYVAITAHIQNFGGDWQNNPDVLILDVETGDFQILFKDIPVDKLYWR